MQGVDGFSPKESRWLNFDSALEDDWLPTAFDTTTYASLNPDLSKFKTGDLIQHYYSTGIHEGRPSHNILNRDEFASLAQILGTVLEIGPFDTPMVRGNLVAYADVLSTFELKLRALAHGRNADTVPEIDYVVEPANLAAISQTFNSVLSSHVVEHQPDLIGHLVQASRLLPVGGFYFLLIPDHRYCFDHFMSPSSLPEIVAAHLDELKKHSTATLLRNAMLTTHNDPSKHWSGDHGNLEPGQLARLSAKVNDHADGWNEYEDVHAWYFTPSTWKTILHGLNQLGLVDLVEVRTYPTLRNQFEFWSVLRKPNLAAKNS